MHVCIMSKKLQLVLGIVCGKWCWLVFPVTSGLKEITAL